MNTCLKCGYQGPCTTCPRCILLLECPDCGSNCNKLFGAGKKCEGPHLLKVAKAQGGLTYDPRNDCTVEVNRGFYVSLAGFESSFDLESIIEEEFDILMSAYSQLARSKGDVTFVGVWVDGGKIYFDLSEHIYLEHKPDGGKKLALVLAERRGQKAIFDCSTKQSIYLETK